MSGRGPLLGSSLNILQNSPTLTCLAGPSPLHPPPHAQHSLLSFHLSLAPGPGPDPPSRGETRRGGSAVRGWGALANPSKSPLQHVQGLPEEILLCSHQGHPAHDHLRCFHALLQCGATVDLAEVRLTGLGRHPLRVLGCFGPQAGLGGPHHPAGW